MKIARLMRLLAAVFGLLALVGCSGMYVVGSLPVLNATTYKRTEAWSATNSHTRLVCGLSVYGEFLHHGRLVETNGRLLTDVEPGETVAFPVTIQSYRDVDDVLVFKAYVYSSGRRLYIGEDVEGFETLGYQSFRRNRYRDIPLGRHWDAKASIRAPC